MSEKNYSVESLHEFIDYVSDKGLVKHATARNWKNAATRIFNILKESEQEDVRGIDIQSVCQRYANLNGKDVTPSSLQTYRSRLKTAVNDFVKYTDDPMSYRPGLSQRPSRKKVDKDIPKQNYQDRTEQFQQEKTIGIESTTISSKGTFPIPIPLRENLIVEVTGVPFDLSEAEADKIARVIKALAIEKN